MAAKDSTFGAGWKDIYLTKKAKPLYVKGVGSKVLFVATLKDKEE